MTTATVTSLQDRALEAAAARDQKNEAHNQERETQRRVELTNKTVRLIEKVLDIEVNPSDVAVEGNVALVSVEGVALKFVEGQYDGDRFYEDHLYAYRACDDAKCLNDVSMELRYLSDLGDFLSGEHRYYHNHYYGEEVLHDASSAPIPKTITVSEHTPEYQLIEAIREMTYRN